MGNYFKFLTCHKKEANNSYLLLAFSYQLTCVLVENLQKETKKKVRNGLHRELTAKRLKANSSRRLHFKFVPYSFYSSN